MKTMVGYISAERMCKWTQSKLGFIQHRFASSPNDKALMLEVANELEELAMGLRYEANNLK